jgi:hypothetical protein
MGIQAHLMHLIQASSSRMIPFDRQPFDPPSDISDISASTTGTMLVSTCLPVQDGHRRRRQEASESGEKSRKESEETNGWTRVVRLAILNMTLG